MLQIDLKINMKMMINQVLTAFSLNLHEFSAAGCELSRMLRFWSPLLSCKRHLKGLQNKESKPAWQACPLSADSERKGYELCLGDRICNVDKGQIQHQMKSQNSIFHQCLGLEIQFLDQPHSHQKTNSAHFDCLTPQHLKFHSYPHFVIEKWRMKSHEWFQWSHH